MRKRTGALTARSKTKAAPWPPEIRQAARRNSQDRSSIPGITTGAPRAPHHLNSAFLSFHCRRGKVNATEGARSTSTAAGLRRLLRIHYASGCPRRPEEKRAEAAILTTRWGRKQISWQRLVR